MSNDKKQLMTRRGFLRTAGIAAAAMAIPVATMPTLTGCRSEKGDEIFKGERKITDHAGRELVIPTPDNLTKTYSTSAMGQIVVFTLDPSRLAGTNVRFTEEELEYLPEGSADLVYMGSLSSGGELDREMIMASGVQVIFSVSGVPITAANISEADGLQEQTSIPVVLVDGSFDNIIEAYRFMGDILGTEKRAEEVAVYLADVYERVTSSLADIADEDRVSLYYAEGPLGLQTEPDTSQHALTFEVAKARNVADVEETVGLGMTNVSLESVLAWNPEVIIAWDDEIRGGADEIIRTDEDWSQIKAVRDGRVYTMPNIPYAWCDRPPGVNRFLGIQWVANMLYPDKYDVDMVEVTKEFYDLVYRVEATEEQIKEILGNSYPPTPRIP